MVRKRQEVQKSGSNTKKKDTPIPRKKAKPAVQKTKGDKSTELDESKKGPLKSPPNYATVSNTRIEKGSSKMEKEESQLDKKGSLLDSKSDHKGSSKDDPKVQLVQSKKDEVCHPEKSDPASSSILPKQSAEKNAFAKEEPSKQSSQEKIGDSLIDKEDIGEGEQRQIQESPQQVSEENNKEDTSEKPNQEKIGNPLSEKEDMVEREKRQI